MFSSLHLFIASLRSQKEVAKKTMQCDAVTPTLAAKPPGFQTQNLFQVLGIFTHENKLAS